MRILVVGAGAIGGYFGGRLLEAKRDVTFLVRPRRAAQLATAGLSIRSPRGDVDLPAPPTILTEGIAKPFDLVLLSCKAYDLEGAITSFAPSVGPETAILPLLNGLRHMEVLTERFGGARVLGGECLISVALDPDSRIVHVGTADSLTFGEQDGSRSARATAIESVFSGARFEARFSESILHEMWEKWVSISTFAGATCLMRAAVGDIVAAGAADLVATLLEECAAIAAHEGFTLRPAAREQTLAMFTQPGSTLKASMLWDIERHAPVEADHIIGDLLRRGGVAVRSPVLRIAYAHLKAYEARRAREAKTGATG